MTGAAETVVVVRLRARPGRGEELRALLGELATRVLQEEPRTLRYAFYTEPGSDPVRITVVEQYASPADRAAHDAGVLVEYLPRLLELVDPAPEVVVLEPADLPVRADPAAAARLRL
ncbi:putative quinol monooxygenase [Pseudonocardia sp. HH130630-07]|uniref:putative quinol monooxygenase n=1 Tax=Pseudonocardia sp. HH130630-07 TaxID=1690815 RepID=UPI0008153083|nr:antibiotic biosynthesis monooxygenase [Pseudonocardia sp. HH130630-07]ANY06847.1 hypothetical protein AFB00_11700 [Pseudonocardia sp. HH130630-07]